MGQFKPDEVGQFYPGVDNAALLVFEDITDRVEDITGETIAEIDAALALLASEIDLNGCSCLENSRANHCDTFHFFNPGIPTPSIYSLPRLSAKMRLAFLSRGVFGLEAVADVVSAAAGHGIKFGIRVELGDTSPLPQEVIEKVGSLLSDISEKLTLR